MRKKAACTLPVKLLVENDYESRKDSNTQKLDSKFNDEENKLEKWLILKLNHPQSGSSPTHLQYSIRQATANEFWDKWKCLCKIRLLSLKSLLQMNIYNLSNNLPAYWGKYVTNVKQNMDISTTPYVQIYTHLKAYEPHAKKTLKKQEQSTSIVDPLAYVASNHFCTLFFHHPQLLVSTHQTSCSGLSSNSKTHATVHDGQIVTEPIQRKAPGNVGNTGVRGKKVICYNCRGDLTCLRGPNAAIAFMANLSSTSAANSQVNEVHSNDNQIFDNVDYQIQEMHQEEHLDSDAETEIDDNTIPYHQYLLDTEANVPTEVSADTSDLRFSMDCHLNGHANQLDGTC
ncbi:hypothetical protein Tco_0902753 [Tanacetum coccineum]